MKKNLKQKSRDSVPLNDFVYSSMSGRLGAVISPYVVELGPLTGLSWLPMAVFAAVSILRQGANSFLKPVLGSYRSNFFIEKEPHSQPE
jgi:hypothetical protein